MYKSARPWILPTILVCISLILRIVVLKVCYPDGVFYDYRATADTIEYNLKFMENIYFPMYTRISGYVFGMSAAYLHYTKGQNGVDYCEGTLSIIGEWVSFLIFIAFGGSDKISL